MSQLICAKVIRKSCPSRDRPETTFRQISLLTEPRTLADFDAVLHLGWSTVPLTSEEMPGLEQATDLPLLQDILDACAAVRRPPHLVFFSTAAVYGNTNVSATEETPCNPLGCYARAKLLAEEIMRAACSHHRGPAVQHLAGIKCFRFGQQLDKTSGNHSSHLPSDS